MRFLERIRNMLFVNKEKLDWPSRLRLCWEVLTKGKYDASNYLIPDPDVLTSLAREIKKARELKEMRRQLDSNVRTREPFNSEYGDQ